MDLQTLTTLVVGASFALYIGIAFFAQARSTGEFYVAGKHVHPVANGMATAADWMSAASFISMAGLIAFLGYDGSVYLMGWTGGYVLLALLLAPYLRKFGKFTVPEFIGDRFYSKAARLVAVICLITASITYVIGQMKGVGVAFGRFLEVPFEIGVMVGQCLNRRIPSKKILTKEIAAWQRQRNAARAKIDWMFTVDRARQKLGRAYPQPAVARKKAAA